MDAKAQCGATRLTGQSASAAPFTIPTEATPTCAPYTGATDGCGAATSPARDGHRPFLTPAQALYLARELFGIGAATDDSDGGNDGGGGSAAVAAAAAAAASAASAESCCCCEELPSYDDRNFRIRVSRQPHQQHLDEQQHRLWSAAEAPEPQHRAQPGPVQQPQPRAGADVGRCVVLKVHNTRDSGRVAQLQAQDEAMLRLRAAGVLTNTPCKPHCRGSVNPAAPSPPALDAAPPPAAAPAAEASGCGGWQGGAAAGQVPWRIAAAAPSSSAGCGGGEGGYGGSAGGEGAAAPCCWALLPCTCHPPQPPTAVSPVGAGRAESAPARSEREAGAGAPEAGAPAAHWHVVRCLSYVPGRTLSSVEALTPTLLRSLGRMMGRVTSAMEGWAPGALTTGPAAGAAARSDWHPESGCGVVRRLVPTIAAFDQEQRSVLLRVADELAAAAPRLGDPSLPRQVCHADANDDNCMLSEGGDSVVGLIDFGDMALMPRVCEVAITMLYAVLLALDRPPMRPEGAAPTCPPRPPTPPDTAHSATTCGGGDAPAAATVPAGSDVHGGDRATGRSDGEEDDAAALRRLLLAAALVLAGYQEIVPLSPPELRLLPLLMRGRLAQSLALGAASVAADPGNAAYLTQTQRPGWRVIRLLTPGSVMEEEDILRYLLMEARERAE